ncbi:MAG: glycoside hydrolase family 5 protein, partial [Vulcanimicrobiaceae bacterium]
TVNWSGLEPSPGTYSADFFAKLDRMIALAEAHHFYVFIDMHQDAYSKEIGEDGAPLWAINPPPTQLLSGPSDDSRRLSGEVLNAGYDFFENLNASDGRPLQDAFATAVTKIVTHVASHSSVLGYEAFNEPVVLQQPELLAFHEKLADAIHAIDRNAPLIFEPIALRNQSDSAVITDTPWSHGPGAYAPHIYTDWFSFNAKSWVSEDPSVLAPSMAAANAEATAWGTPLVITEFGCDLSQPQCALWQSAELDLQDRYLASSTIWEWAGPGTWTLYDDTGAFHAGAAKITSRTFPRAVAGTIVSITRPAPGDLVVKYTTTPKTESLEHEVSMSPVYATGYSVTCDGVSVAFTQAIGRATFVCPNGPAAADGTHTFEVVGTPVP